ncbi:MAG: DUF2784 domain-containing protein [Betaproteobacteria bacterium]
MPYGLLADALVLVHFAFVGFVLLGGLAVAWRSKLAWLHLPAVTWAILLEWNGWICPLTPWEQRLRMAGGAPGYGGDFIDHYVVPVLYPAGLTPRIQLLLAAVVIVVNVGIYAWIIGRRFRSADSAPVSPARTLRPKRTPD